MISAFIISSSYVSGQGIPNIHSLDFSKLRDAAPVAAFAAPAGALILGSALYSLFKSVGWVITVFGSAAMAFIILAFFFKPEMQALMQPMLG